MRPVQGTRTQPQVGRLLEPADAGRVGAGVAAPVADDADDLDRTVAGRRAGAGRRVPARRRAPHLGGGAAGLVVVLLRPSSPPFYDEEDFFDLVEDRVGR